MKIYIAARFSRQQECLVFAELLQGMGHVVTSRWIFPEFKHITLPENSAEESARDKQRFATEDYNDVVRADTVISLTEPPRGNGRGGRHVEFGIGLGLQKRLIIVGPQENVFHFIQGVEVCKSIDDCLKLMGVT